MPKRTRTCVECGTEFKVVQPKQQGRRCPACVRKKCARAAYARNVEKIRKRDRERKRIEKDNERRCAEAAREAARGYARGNDKCNRHVPTRNDQAEWLAMRAVEILQVEPDRVTDQMWETLCVLYGGEPMGASNYQCSASANK